MVSGEIAHQGLEEWSRVVGLSLEDVLVALPLQFSIGPYLIAQLLGNDCGEGLENALLTEVPASILCTEDHDQLVDARALCGPDLGRSVSPLF